MIIERTKNATRNIITGIINRTVVLLLPFITRTLMIKLIGVQYLGLNSLFSSVLQVLNLAELGVGSAIVFSMYRAIAEDDEKTINALLNLYRKIYHMIGGVVLILGVALMPFLKVMINQSYPEDINIYIIYLVFLSDTVISYFLFAYRASLFSAHQRNDVTNNISSIITITKYILQIIFLILSKNYYIYIFLIPVCTVLSNIIQWHISKRMYPQFVCEGRISAEMEKDIKKRIKGLISYKIYGVIFNSVDTIVISSFLGLSMLAIYNNYYYIMNALVGFLAVLMNSMTAGIGNSIVKENVEKNYNDFRRFTFINAWICGWCTVCLMCLYQPFMKLWMGEELLLPMKTVILFVLFFFSTRVASLTYLYKEASGIWWEDRWRPIVAAIVNLSLNIFFITRIGLNGVILSTLICTIFINIPWGSYVLFRTYFLKSPKEYYKNLLIYAIVTSGVSAVTYWVCSFIQTDSIVSFLGKGMICLSVPNVLFYLCYYRNKEFILAASFIKKIVKPIQLRLKAKIGFSRQ